VGGFLDLEMERIVPRENAVSSVAGPTWAYCGRTRVTRSIPAENFEVVVRSGPALSPGQIGPRKLNRH